MLYVLLLVWGLSRPSTALAQPTVAQPATELHAGYETYAVGVPVAQMQTSFGLGPTDYRIALAFHTTGLIGALFGGHQTSNVVGRWEGDRPQPLHFTGDGVWRGQARQIAIDYQGGEPLVRKLVPAQDAEREPVPAELQARSIDTLSAVALLMRRVAKTGRCDIEARTFDGRRAVDVAAHTVGPEPLEPSSRTTFAGTALRCDFEGRMLAGFLREGDQSALRKPQHGSAWFASVVPGAPPIPVRISFDTRWFGPATMYLTGAGPGATAIAP